jgi:radical SAM superfamily enzyme YgiQ (UPF0313 family)
MAKKKGLLIAPAFPDDSFWSFKHVMKYIGRKTAFPPLGLITFAAQMPQDEWEFDFCDLNVEIPNTADMRRRIQEADAVFASAMSIQRSSLVQLLDGPARGTDTPWVLGGPMASTYRDAILEPKSDRDRILCEGLDYLVWGESTPWIEDICKTLESKPLHSSEQPFLFIPERVKQEPDGSRKYLQDKEIFKPLDNVPVPRWDLVNPNHYRALMLQTTAGCRFRCNFCDIVQFNGGFARAKDKTAVTRELQAIYDTGFRGGVFTVDDNFVSEPEDMEHILDGMIDFQRGHNYPFHLFTQASVDLGKDSLAYLIPRMKQAGFTAVFLGIESPDQDSLKSMNKIQNVKTDPKDTVSLIQQQGIEVYAGFIYGTDTDTRQSADLIVDFVKGNGIFSSMTGKLTPMPHTPLYVELKNQGRLIEDGEAGNNVDDSLQYRPVMSVEHLHEGFSHILSSLFTRQAIYLRARTVLDRVHSHIFVERSVGFTEKLGALRSFFTQGLRGRDGSPDFDYFRFLRDALQVDRTFARQARHEARNLINFWNGLSGTAKDRIELDAKSMQQFSKMLEYAQESLVRFSTDKKLDEIRQFVNSVGESLRRGDIVRDHAQSVFQGAIQYLDARRDMFRFPGPHLHKAFELAIMGSHYRMVAGKCLQTGDAEGMTMPS